MHLLPVTSLKGLSQWCKAASKIRGTLLILEGKLGHYSREGVGWIKDDYKIKTVRKDSNKNKIKLKG